MTNTSGSKSDPEDRFIARTEFAAFERSVEKGFRGVSESIGHLSSKLDRISSRGTDWRAIFAGMSALTAILAAIGGVVAWGIVSRLEATDAGLQALASAHSMDVRAVDEALDRRLEERAVRTHARLDGYGARLEALEVLGALNAQKVDDLRAARPLGGARE